MGTFKFYLLESHYTKSRVFTILAISLVAITMLFMAPASQVMAAPPTAAPSGLNE